MSGWRETNSRVHQESVFGSLLFNNLTNVLHMLMTQSWKRTEHHTERTGWSQGKMMNFNGAKCKVSHSGTINKSSCCKPRTLKLGITNERKYLGLLADPWIIMNHQCDTVMKQTNTILERIRQYTSDRSETMTDISGGYFACQPSSEKIDSQRNRSREGLQAW